MEIKKKDLYEDPEDVKDSLTLGVIPVDLKKDRTQVKFRSLTTHDGHKLTFRQMRFIEHYINSGGAFRESLSYAGYALPKSNAMVSKKVKSLFQIPYIRDEIEYQLDELRKSNIADREEILEYFTAVMRGEVKDQFGLDAPLGERTDAAKELAKRIIDTEDKLLGKQEQQVVITLDWSRNPENQEHIVTEIPTVSD